MSCETELPAVWNFPTTFEGGGIESREFTIAEENSAALASATIVFKLAGSDTAALTLNSGDELTLDSVASGNWVITLEQDTAHGLAAGVYAYNLTTVDADGFPMIYFCGTMEVKNT